LAEHAYDTGRATVAIDLPGVGESESNPYVAGLEDAAFVVDQVADLLRARFEHVVGVGHSLGAAVVAVAQGLFTSFDAIVPAAYSHGGPPAKDECSSRPGVGIRKTLFTSYADPRVVEDFARWLRPPKATFALAVQELGPFEDDVTATITVPILIVLGGNDCVFDRSRYGEEPSHYPMAKDVRLVVLPRTGHAVFHHLDHRRVDRLVATWLTQHRL
jgi:pimeloyl-ACP methyl ester carboxylesterase